MSCPQYRNVKRFCLVLDNQNSRLQTCDHVVRQNLVVNALRLLIYELFVSLFLFLIY